MSNVKKLVLGGAAWGLAAFGILSLARLPGQYNHSLCGPWGCLPPLQALAAMHLFWVVVLFPLVAWALAKGPPRYLPLAGMLLFLSASLGIVAVVGRDLQVWLRAVSPVIGAYWPRRALHTILTLTDVPLVQLLLAGAICWSVGRARRSRSAALPHPDATNPL